MYKTRSQAGETVLGTIAIIIVAVILVAGIGVVGWQFNWWLEGKNTDKQVEVDNRNKGTQTAWYDEVKSSIADFELVDDANLAAKGALRNKACDLIPRLTETYRDEDIVAFEERECS